MYVDPLPQPSNLLRRRLTEHLLYDPATQRMECRSCGATCAQVQGFFCQCQAEITEAEWDLACDTLDGILALPIDMPVSRRQASRRATRAYPRLPFLFVPG